MSVPQKLHGFVLKDSHEYKDCGYTGYLYQNEKFNCPFLYLRTEDTNNFFSVHFRTPEEDNTGISHMLEHLSLLGSQKYPIRNIFFELNKRSYSTFMNAFTSSEYTAFPFSSINQTDFFNDLDVYLDSVFHPKLSEVNFLSECHHLSFEDGDPNKPLVHGGVIYNEVVGIYSKQYTIFNRKIMENLYPDSPSRFDHGGTPSDIPKATYESVVNHHRQYYHPVNSFFYLYGNSSFPMDQVFQKVAEVIDQFEVIESPYHPELYEMQPWTEPRTVVIDAPADDKTPLEDQQQLTISFLINEKATNDKLISELDFLVEILGRSNNSPLYQSLVLPGHVKNIYMVLNLNLLYPLISITATGFLKEKTAEIEKMIMTIIKDFSEDESEKIEEERLNCFYHNIRLQNKKVPENLGLVLFHCFAHQWIHGSNPLLLIDFDSNLEESYNESKQKGFLKKLAKRFLIENKHVLFARLNPVVGYNENLIEEDKKNLEEIKKNLTPQQIQEILDNMKKISEEMAKPQPIDLLPQIHCSDISKEVDFKPADEVYKEQINVFLNPTNGVVYASIVVVHDAIDIPNMWLIPFMNAVSSAVGAGRFTEYELSMYTQRWVSSLSSLARSINTIEGEKKIELSLRCSSLNEDIDKLNELLKITATEIHWNNLGKIEIIVRQFRNIFGKVFLNKMESFNDMKAAALLDEKNAFDEATAGLIGFNKFRNFLNSHSVDQIAKECERLYKTILTNGKIKAFISCGEKIKEKAVKAIEDVIDAIQKVPKFEYAPVNYSEEVFEKMKSKKTFINMPMPTGTVCLKKLCLKSYNAKTAAYLCILGRILTNEALINEIREKNGAYSVGASFSARTGVFSISTYRDTVPQKNYERILEIVKNVNNYITEESVERAVVSYLSSLDSPYAPPKKGLAHAKGGITYEYLKEQRDAFLDATVQDVKEATKYLIEGEFNVSIATSLNVAEPPEGFEIIQI